MPTPSPRKQTATDPVADEATDRAVTADEAQAPPERDSLADVVVRLERLERHIL